MDALLLSGGVDSVALAAWRRPQVGITIDYGQACASAEFRAAAQVCRDLKIDHHCLTVSAAELGSGDLAGKPAHPEAPASDWWPFRNQFLLTVGAMRAVALGLDRLLIGIVKSDSFHSDGTGEFVEWMDGVLKLQEGHLRVDAPAIRMTSVKLIRESRIPMSVLCWAHSCHTANQACGRCRGCNKHRDVMAELGYEPY